MNDIIHIFVRQGIIQRQAHDFLIQLFRFRAQTLFIAQLFVVGMSVNRDIVYVAADVFRRHGCKELLSVNGKHFRLDTQDIQMPCGIGLRDFFLYGNFRNL